MLLPKKKKQTVKTGKLCFMFSPRALGPGLGFPSPSVFLLCEFALLSLLRLQNLYFEHLIGRVTVKNVLCVRAVLPAQIPRFGG